MKEERKRGSTYNQKRKERKNREEKVKKEENQNPTGEDQEKK